MSTGPASAGSVCRCSVYTRGGGASGASGASPDRQPSANNDAAHAPALNKQRGNTMTMTITSTVIVSVAVLKIPRLSSLPISSSRPL